MMNTRRVVEFVKSFVLIVLACCCAELSFAQDVPPSLAETLNWMDNTYNSHRDIGGSWGHAQEEIYAGGILYKRRISTFTYDGCLFSLKTQQDPAARVYSSVYASEVIRFNLRDIDPSTIKTILLDPNQGGLPCKPSIVKMVCSIAEIEFETHNQLPLMDYEFHSVYPNLLGAEHDSSSKGKTFIAAFYVDDAAYSVRFANAFSHAISLCGGKASAF